MPTKLIVKYQRPVETLAADRFRNETLIPVENEETIGIVETNADGQNEWDAAHEFIKTDQEIVYAEPDVNTSAAFYPPESLAELAKITEIKYDSYLEDWPAPDKPQVWHIAEKYTGLKAAREEVKGLNDKKKIRIAHFDTGYDEEHLSFPKELINLDLQRNFVEGEDPRNAEDRFSTGMTLQPGHGTGTLSILAGNKMPIAGCTDFDDYVGLEEAIEIVPIRIAKSVLLFKSSAFVEAMHYILDTLNKNEDTKVHVITMSMGGVASRAWADVVNKAYDEGIFIVTAGGNNFFKFPTKRLVFPARFNRVVAACGVSYDLTPYAKPPGQGRFNLMEGNHGPRSLMKTALAAFTPNVPWAIWKQKNLFGIRGDGTSSATPQIAAAAALYYSKYYKDLEKLPEPYMIVEAIRNALFTSATKTINGENLDYRDYFGNGILNAKKALEVPVPDENFLRKQRQKKDKVFLPFLKMIFGIKAVQTPEEELQNRETEMLETELMQLALTDKKIQQLLDKDETDSIIWMEKEQRLQLARLVEQNSQASQTLKQKMKEVIQYVE